jgi:hypothetical protein
MLCLSVEAAVSVAVCVFLSADISQAEVDWIPVFVMCLLSEPEGPSCYYFDRMLEMSFKGKRNF